MSNIFKVGSVVVILQGRQAGKKAVVISLNAGHVLVAGMNTFPKAVLPSHTVKQAEKRSKFTTFVKSYNPKHLMPTRYTHKHTLQQQVKTDMLKDKAQKEKAVKKIQEAFESDFLGGSDSWLFKKLPF
ncbi:Ribosomal protein L27 [Spironucleus salmonicida]|uniref:Ribosomal protein L27 n=1 Tax=Spironucleus salmonicida TaxID=348837 RepID=V6LW83_9EUKA|nr:Ribosomal protein L27 [Spironucleus salmonicida]|eukprot:EST48508.1 Ribosomal protein L27 [Spironucleus salmonicida]